MVLLYYECKEKNSQKAFRVFCKNINRLKTFSKSVKGFQPALLSSITILLLFDTHLVLSYDVCCLFWCLCRYKFFLWTPRFSSILTRWKNAFICFLWSSGTHAAEKSYLCDSSISSIITGSFKRIKFIPTSLHPLSILHVVMQILERLQCRHHSPLHYQSWHQYIYLLSYLDLIMAVLIWWSHLSNHYILCLAEYWLLLIIHIKTVPVSLLQFQKFSCTFLVTWFINEGSLMIWFNSSINFCASFCGAATLSWIGVGSILCFSWISSIFPLTLNNLHQKIPEIQECTPLHSLLMELLRITRPIFWYYYPINVLKPHLPHENQNDSSS